eukprot:15179289-Alexandrium_andersonii.AAC.1
MRRLRSAFVGVVDARASPMRSVDLALATAYPREIDPLAHVMCRRVVAFRRAWFKQQWLRPYLRQAYEALATRGHPATKVPDQGGAEDWPISETSCHGPVALLLQTCWRAGLAVDGQWQ